MFFQCPGLCRRSVLGLCVAGGGPPTAEGRSLHRSPGRGDADPSGGEADLQGEDPRLGGHRSVFLIRFLAICLVVSSL